jgi:hypothetical protein
MTTNFETLAARIGGRFGPVGRSFSYDDKSARRAFLSRWLSREPCFPAFRSASYADNPLSVPRGTSFFFAFIAPKAAQNTRCSLDTLGRTEWRAND